MTSTELVALYEHHLSKAKEIAEPTENVVINTELARTHAEIAAAIAARLTPLA